jgi:hypothetical protein
MDGSGKVSGKARNFRSLGDLLAGEEGICSAGRLAMIGNRTR